MVTKKHKLLSNYSHFDWAYLYPHTDDAGYDIIVKIREYQSPFRFNNSQSAIIEVHSGSKQVLVLEDDGNGINTNLGPRLDYCDAQRLTYALMAYEDLSKWKRTCKKIDL